MTAEASAVRPTPHKTAAGCVVVARRTGRILACLRAATVPSPRTWGTWGGKSEPGETPIQTALRELHEETGHAAESDPVHLHRLSTNGFTYDTFVVLVDDEFVPVIGVEADGFAWVPLDRIPAPLHWGFGKLLSDRRAAERLARAVEAASGRPCRVPGQPASSRPKDKGEARCGGRRRGRRRTAATASPATA